MKKVFLFCLLAGLCMASHADTLAEIDSLLQVYDQSKGQARMGVAKELMAIYADFPVFFDEPPALTDGMSDSNRDLLVWYAAERFFTSCAYYAEALDYNRRALPFVEEVELPDVPAEAPSPTQDLLATLLCDRSYCLFKTSDYVEAVETAQRSVDVCRRTGNRLQLARAYLYIALVNHALQNHEEAMDQVTNAIKVNEELNDDRQLHNTLGIACEIFCSGRQADKAVEYGLQAVDVARRMGYDSGVANHLLQLSYAYDRKGDYHKGIEAADEAIAIIRRLEPLDRNQLALALEYKSWNLIDIGRHREAADALHEAIRLEREVGNTHAAWNDYRTLSEALEPFDPHGAVEALRIYTRLGDSIHSEQLKQLMTKANAQLHNDELQEENAQSRRQNHIILWTAVVVVLLLVAAIASLWFAFRQKKRSAQALQRLTEAREEFFTNVTHELRTPLTIILGVGEELSREHSLGETIVRQGRQLLNLVNQLLDLSKVKSALGAQPLAQGDVASYVAMIVENHQEQARRKGVTVSYETDEGGIETSYVADYIEKMVDNLLSNAVKFTPKGGHVSVSLHRLQDRLQFIVSDTGRGIAPEHLPRLFEPFYRGDASDVVGSGVGLALVKQIVDALKGSIDVESKVGEGTTFTVRVQAQQLQESQQPHSQLHPKGGELSRTTAKNGPTEQTGNHALKEGKKGGIPLLLIVEDNADMASLIGRQMEGRYSISYASDGAEGVTRAHELMPDLIITDLMMPGTDGLELCRTLRADDVTNHIPIIVVTAKATENDRIMGLRAGADAYLYKPFNTDELQVRVEKLLEQRELLRKKFGNPAEPLDSALENQDDDNSFAPSSVNFVERVRQCVIDLMPTHECDVEHVASRMNLSPFQLRSKLTTITGITPKRYILRIQLEMARQMLSNHPERKVLDVAERCGFYDQSHFTRLFRDAFGLTPGDYLKQQG